MSLDLSTREPNQVFVRVYYNPREQSEVNNMSLIRFISRKLAYVCDITTTEDYNRSRDIGCSLINGGVIRKDWSNETKGQLVLVFNEREFFVDPQNNFNLLTDFSSDYYGGSEMVNPFYADCLWHICQVLEKVRDTTYKRDENFELYQN